MYIFNRFARKINSEVNNGDLLYNGLSLMPFFVKVMIQINWLPYPSVEKLVT